VHVNGKVGQSMESELILRQHLQQRWQAFRKHGFPTLDAIVKAESWL